MISKTRGGRAGFVNSSAVSFAFLRVFVKRLGSEYILGNGVLGAGSRFTVEPVNSARCRSPRVVRWRHSLLLPNPYVMLATHLQCSWQRTVVVFIASHDSHPVWSHPPDWWSSLVE